MKVLNMLFGKGVSEIPVSNKGVELNISGYGKQVYPWSTFNRITFVEYLDEYSGYAYTDEFKEKKSYDDIIMDTPNNVVKIRTVGKTKEIVSDKTPFRHEYGTTYLHYTALFEMNLEGKKVLYGLSVKKNKYHTIYKDVSKFAGEGLDVNNYRKLAGFSSLNQLELF